MSNGCASPRASRRNLVLILVIAVMAAALLIGLIALGNYRRPRPAPLPSRPKPQYRTDLGDTFNFLLTGRDARLIGDRRQDGKQRNRRDEVYHSDVIILAHFNLLRPRVTLLSIPRDMLVSIPGYTRAEHRTDFYQLDKITHASAYGRDSLLERTIGHNFRIRIHRRVALDFDSFRLIYALLQPFLGRLQFGNRVLSDPEQALMFVRDRRHYPNDDLDRSRHAVLFVKTLIQRTWGRLSNRLADWLLPRLLAIIGADTNLSADDLSYCIAQLRARRFNPDSIETAVLIGYETPVTLRNYGQTLSCCLPVYDENARQIDYYLRDRTEVPTFSFMSQNQKIRYPAYCFENYDLLGDTAAKAPLVDTTSPSYRHFRLEHDSLPGRRTRTRDSLLNFGLPAPARVSSAEARRPDSPPGEQPKLPEAEGVRPATGPESLPKPTR